MAHIRDRWERVVDGHRVRTPRYGTGLRWHVRYRDPDGRDRTKGFARKADAERFLAGVTADMARGAYVDPDAGRATLNDFAERWLRAQTFGDTTRETTEHRLRLHVLPALGSRELRDIRPSVVQAWLRHLQQELAPTYVRTIFVTLTAVLNAAVDDGLIAKNPCKAGSVRTPRVDVRHLEPWSASHVAAVMDQLPPRYRALAVVAAGCGLRQGEAFGLRVQDVDFLQRRIKVEQQVKLLRGQVVIDRPKGGRTRVVPMPDAIALELSEHLRRYPAERHELIFRSREGKPMNRNYFNHHVWRPAVTRAGIEAGRPNGMHALRHFYASVLIDAGESVKAVAEFLGHRDAGFTLRVYAHLFPSSDDRARLAVDGVLRPALTGSEGRISTAGRTRPSGAPSDS